MKFGVGMATALVVSMCFAVGSAHADTVITGGTDPTAKHVSLIGDSTLAGVRWNNTWGTIGAYNYVFDAESCRRTIGASCKGREGSRRTTTSRRCNVSRVSSGRCS